MSWAIMTFILVENWERSENSKPNSRFYSGVSVFGDAKAWLPRKRVRHTLACCRKANMSSQAGPGYSTDPPGQEAVDNAVAELQGPVDSEHTPDASRDEEKQQERYAHNTGHRSNS